MTAIEQEQLVVDRDEKVLPLVASWPRYVVSGELMTASMVVDISAIDEDPCGAVIAPRFSQSNAMGNQLELFNDLWRIEPFSETPNRSKWSAPQDETVGALVNLPPSTSQSSSIITCLNQYYTP